MGLASMLSVRVAVLKLDLLFLLLVDHGLATEHLLVEQGGKVNRVERRERSLVNASNQFLLLLIKLLVEYLELGFLVLMVYFVLEIVHEGLLRLVEFLDGLVGEPHNLVAVDIEINFLAVAVLVAQVARDLLFKPVDLGLESLLDIVVEWFFLANQHDAVFVREHLVVLEEAIVTVEALEDEAKVVTLHLVEQRVEDVFLRLVVDVLELDFLASVVEVVDKSVDLDALVDDEQLLINYVFLQRFELRRHQLLRVDDWVVQVWVQAEDGFAAESNRDSEFLSGFFDELLASRSKLIEDVERNEVAVELPGALVVFEYRLVDFLAPPNVLLEELAQEHEHVVRAVDMLTDVDHKNNVFLLQVVEGALGTDILFVALAVEVVERRVLVIVALDLLHVDQHSLDGLILLLGSHVVPVVVPFLMHDRRFLIEVVFELHDVDGQIKLEIEIHRIFN